MKKSAKDDQRKKTADSRKKEASRICSLAAEYLTFVAASGKGGVEAVYADENIWLTQKMMGLLYDVETHTINYYLKKFFAAGGKSYNRQVEAVCYFCSPVQTDSEKTRKAL